MLAVAYAGEVSPDAPEVVRLNDDLRAGGRLRLELLLLVVAHRPGIVGLTGRTFSRLSRPQTTSRPLTRLKQRVCDAVDAADEKRSF
jgi:hypothetical protein